MLWRVLCWWYLLKLTSDYLEKGRIPCIPFSQWSGKIDSTSTCYKFLVSTMLNVHSCQHMHDLYRILKKKKEKLSSPDTPWQRMVQIKCMNKVWHHVSFVNHFIVVPLTSGHFWQVVINVMFFQHKILLKWHKGSGKWSILNCMLVLTCTRKGE